MLALVWKCVTADVIIKIIFITDEVTHFIEEKLDWSTLLLQNQWMGVRTVTFSTVLKKMSTELF